MLIGLPQVNIQTPNAQGLSHNKYSKFDVDTKGAVLNNSRTNVQTQQGGWVQGNSYLARGEAKVILNEVNSSDPSVLNRVKYEVDSAYKNRTEFINKEGRSMWRGKTISGVDVQGYLEPKTTVYPIMKIGE
nr:hypothetical protein [Rodentibacter ratti]